MYYFYSLFNSCELRMSDAVDSTMDEFREGQSFLTPDDIMPVSLDHSADVTDGDGDIVPSNLGHDADVTSGDGVGPCGSNDRVDASTNTHTTASVDDRRQMGLVLMRIRQLEERMVDVVTRVNELDTAAPSREVVTQKNFELSIDRAMAAGGTLGVSKVFIRQYLKANCEIDAESRYMRRRLNAVLKRKTDKDEYCCNGGLFRKL